MDYKTYNFPNYNIHIIKTNRFKNIQMEIALRNNIDKNTYLNYFFLVNMLMESNSIYKTKREIVLKEEELYEANCYIYYRPQGKSIIYKLNMDILNPKYTKDNYLEEAIKFPFDLLLHPDINNNKFNEKSFKTVKTRFKDNIKTQKEVLSQYACKEALKAMDKKSLSALNRYGTITELNKITDETLLNAYNNLLTNSLIDISIIGDINEDEIIKYINKYAIFNNNPNTTIEYHITNKERTKVLEKTSTSKKNQSHIVYLLNTNNLTEYEREYVMPLYNIILGGASLESKLYRTLRDKHSLCYGVYSAYFEFDNLLRITTSVDKKNIKKAKSLINKTIKDMYNISDTEIKRAISLYESSINSYLDNPSYILDLYLNQFIFNTDSIEERINKIKKVTIEEIINLNKKIKLNTIYTLEGDNHE